MSKKYTDNMLEKMGRKELIQYIKYLEETVATKDCMNDNQYNMITKLRSECDSLEETINFICYSMCEAGFKCDDCIKKHCCDIVIAGAVDKCVTARS